MSMYQLLLKLASSVPDVPLIGDELAREVNRIGVNHFARSIPARPRPFSMWSASPPIQAPGSPQPPDYVTDYTSWPGLTDRSFSARHLGPASGAYVAGLPPHALYVPKPQIGPADQVTELFMRKGRMKPSRSSLLFMFFAQWFTDSVFRFDSADRRRNTSNHDIDLCEIYGLTEAHANILRSHQGGKLRSQLVNGGEYPEYLCTSAVGGAPPKVKPHFAGLLPIQPGTDPDPYVDAVLAGSLPMLSPAERAKRKEKLYATGLERGNSSVGYVAISTIFLREHNRLATALANANPGWSDERLFQTARNINIVLLLKLVVEDYINHILGHSIFRLDVAFAEAETWYRPNWIAVEFDLLYRWHGLVPDAMTVGGNVVPHSEFRFNNALLEAVGVGPLIDEASRQPAGKIGLQNSPDFLWTAESLSIQMGRDFRLRPYNDYRVRFGLDPITSYADLTSDRPLQHALARLYPNAADLEFVVGLFAEEPDDGMLFGDLLNQMVAYDAFTQIFSNPLLSRNVYDAATFTQYGLDVIDATTSIDALVDRNVAQPVRASLAL